MKTEKTPEKRKPGRPRKAAIERLASGKHGARPTFDVDGVAVRRRLKFETGDPALAQKKTARLQEEGGPALLATSAATFEEECALVLDAREKRGVSGMASERGNMKNHVYTFTSKLRPRPFGARVLASISPEEVTELLEALREQGYSKTTVNHIRKGIKYVFDARRRPGLTAMPIFKKVMKKERSILPDEVLIIYVAWQHPVERFRGAVLMRQTMSAVARCYGGQRTIELHTFVWEQFDIDEGRFPEGRIVRGKSKQNQRLDIPPRLVPIIRAWWEHQGRPVTGPVFPLLRGEHAGEARVKQDSHAAAMRQDVKRALGIEVWAPEAGQGKKGPVGRWVPGRPMTRQEREMFTETPFTLPADFHSWRRAWTQALAKLGVDVAVTSAMTAHQDIRTTEIYLRNSQAQMQVPEGAVPDFSGKMGFGRELAKTRGEAIVGKDDDRKGSEGLESAPGRIRTFDPWLRRHTDDYESPGFSAAVVVSGHEQNVEKTTGDDCTGQYSRPIFGGLDGALRVAVDAAMAEGDIESATALLEVARRRRASPPDNVLDLAARKRPRST